MLAILRKISNISLALGLGLAPLTGAFAQPAELAIPADKDWQHDWTPMTFPARIGGFERERVLQFEERQTNVAATYWSEEGKTLLSVYIYRPGNPDSAIWFDRALIAIGARDIFGDVDLDDVKVGSFVPNGGDQSSGQYAILKLNGRFKSTAVSLYQAGEWLVKLRISSEELSVSQMDDLLRTTQSNLPQLDGVSDRAAYFIAPCEDALSDKPATIVEAENGITEVLGVGLGTSTVRLLRDAIEENGGDLPEAAAPAYCRQGERAANFNIYRPNGRTDRYFIAAGDAGVGITAAPDPLRDALENEDDKRDPIIVTSSSGLETYIHAAFQGTPNVEQTIEAVNNGRLLGSVNRPLGDEGQSFNVFVIGDEAAAGGDTPE